MHRAEQDEFKTRRKSRSRRAKNQAPNPKLQRSSKSQAPNPKNRCRCNRCAGPFLSLELGASLELGVWNLELFALALSFSKIEIRPGRSRSRTSPIWRASRRDRLGEDAERISAGHGAHQAPFLLRVDHRYIALFAREQNGQRIQQGLVGRQAHRWRTHDIIRN